MNKQANLNCIMIVQQLEEEYWLNWDKKYLDEANKGNLYPLLEEIIKKLDGNTCDVSELYGIIHNKDIITVWDETQMKNVIEKKAKHVHILIKFNKGDTLNSLAMKIGIESQYLEKAKSGRYGYDNLTAYLVHAKDAEKFQYDPKEVVTGKGEDYLSVYNRRMEKWMKGRATKEATETNQSIDYVVSEILAGNLSKSQIMLTNELYKIYALHKRKINEAFETLGESKSYQTMADLDAGYFKKTTIFIHGESGTGKTILSKEIIDVIKQLGLHHEGITWDYCMTASTNPFDEYNGQDILLLDDIRGYSLNVADWLKLLDPYTISPLSARYHNKLGSAKIIIITSSKTPIEFFNSAQGNDWEDTGQFIRRLDLLITIENDTNEKKFKLFTSVPNKANQDESAKTSSLYSYTFEKVNDFNNDNLLIEVRKKIQTNMKWKEKNLPQESAKTTVASNSKSSK